MTDRQKQILRAIVREYIKDAEPVGSKVLSERFDFGIGPAMIRKELAELEREGYITQPHTSAGRVPTDKAYRAYIAELEGGTGAELPTREKERVDHELARGDDSHELLRELSRVVADISGELSVAGLESGEARYVHGFSQLMDEPELQNPLEMRDLFRFMDEMDVYFDRMWSALLKSEYGVLVGRENPIKEIQSFSVITGRYTLPQGEAGFVSIIGPRRMDYRKNVALVRYVTKQMAKGK
jgi:transcriptional regulator of heat shock response